MAAHLLRLNYEAEASVNIFHKVFHTRATASLFIIWPQSILTKIKAPKCGAQKLDIMAII